MGLNGEDKRIRALFCELKREEEHASPLFAKTWNIAEAEFHRSNFGRPRLQLSSNLLRFATAILLVSFVSLVLAATVLLPRYLRPNRQPKHDYAKQGVAAGPLAASEEPLRSGKVPANRESGKPTDRLVAILRAVRVKKSQVAVAKRARPVNQIKQSGLSEWQSPTAKLLRSAGDELLRFVPQMNESAEEMKKFLTNDLN
ncbi:MAG TPA: hypothetical protein VEW46_02085 [Pyrinomonadaceae bacterium]|nr:hypothetical protein [Pyrinomonadaceae bacterium]